MGEETRVDPDSRALGVAAVQDRCPCRRNREGDGACWPGCDRRPSLGNPKRHPFGENSFGQKKEKCLFNLSFMAKVNDKLHRFTFRVPDKR